MTDEKLLQNLAERIATNPGIVPDVLDAVRTGMTAWEARVKRNIDNKADHAISSALGLPARIRDWKTANSMHASFARVVAVGWGLVLRKASSGLEVDLVDFVRRADAAEPDIAGDHYRILRSDPIPPKG